MANDKDKKAPLFSSITRTDEMVTVEVGSEPVKYYIHKALLVHHSDYFRNALSGPWKEAQERKVDLKDAFPGIFNIFVNWLYTQQLPQSDLDWAYQVYQHSSVSNTDVSKLRIMIYLTELRCYAFADRIMALGYRQAVHNNHVDKTWGLNSVTPHLLVQKAFEWCPRAQFLQLLIDRHCAFWKEKHDYPIRDYLERHPNISADFMIRVMIKYSNLRHNKDEKPIMNRCYYHEHNSEEERKECEKNCEGEKNAF